MYYRPLGKSQLSISVIGFGCMSLGVSEAENTHLIHRALASGINFLDTADLYNQGLNEEMVGKIIKAKREQVVLATKVGNQWRRDGSGWDWNPRKKYILSAVEASLTRLQTDRIDLYQLHGGTMEDPIDETIEAFEQLKQEGKIRYYGLSSIRPDVIREYLRRSGIISVMIQYSLLDRRAEESCLDVLKNSGTGVLVRGALARGLLVDKPAARYLEYDENIVKNASLAIHSLSGTSRSPAQTALQYVLKNDAVTSIVTGLRTITQLEDALRTADTPGLTNDEVQALCAMVPVNFYDRPC